MNEIRMQIVFEDSNIPTVECVVPETQTEEVLTSCRKISANTSLHGIVNHISALDADGNELTRLPILEPLPERGRPKKI